MEDIKQDMEPLAARCIKVKATLVSVSQNLKEHINRNAQNIKDVEDLQVINGTNVNFSGDIARWDNWLAALETEIANLITTRGSYQFSQYGIWI